MLHQPCHCDAAQCEVSPVGGSGVSVLPVFALRSFKGPNAKQQVARGIGRGSSAHDEGRTEAPRRTLIRGRVGAGKTSLCKSIVFEFARGRIWRNRLSRVPWMPLRSLKSDDRCRQPGYGSGEPVSGRVLFSQHPRGNDLAKALWNASHRAEGGRTLFLLDGLDEIRNVGSETAPLFSRTPERAQSRRHYHNDEAGSATPRRLAISPVQPAAKHLCEH